MMRNFGRVGGYLGSGTGYSSPSRSAAGSPALGNAAAAARRGAQWNRQYRRPGIGDGLDGSGYYGYGGLAATDYGSGYGATGGYSPPLQARNATTDWMGAVPRPFGTELAAAVHTTTLQEQRKSIQELGVRDKLHIPDYLGWMPRERTQAGVPSADVDKSSIYEPVVSAASPDESKEDQPKRTLSEIVANHLTGLRQTYAAQGWSAFQSGDYQGALRRFSLAENASLDSPRDRAYYKLVLVYGGIAAGQYNHATNSIVFLLDRDRQTGRLLHAGVFNRIFDENNVKIIGELYEKPGTDRPPGYQNPAYKAHNQAIDTAFSQDQNSAALRAMMALVEWGRGRRTEAIFLANRISDPTGRLNQLGPVLEEAERLRQRGDGTPIPAVPKPGETPSAGTRPAS
jgi:hypothetical protein